MANENQSDNTPEVSFPERMLTLLNDGGLCLMISIGHRTGLFDTMRDMPPATSGEIAAKAGLHERYVREWLGAMTTGRIVELDAESARYSLPADRAAFLTRSAGSDNIALYTQYIALLGRVEDRIVNCFRQGGGVPYSEMPRFHEVMAEDSALSVLSVLESDILPMVPGLVERLQTGIAVLDAGCGRGLILSRMAQLFPFSRFTGIDLSEEAIQFAAAAATQSQLANIEFQARDLSDFDEQAQPEAFDFVTTFDAIHDQAKPRNVLRGIFRTLKRDGTYLMQDINGSSYHHKNKAHPLGPLLYTVSCMHCMTVSLAQGGEGLGTMWGEEKTRDYLKTAGFQSIETKRLPHDIMNNWYVVRK